MSPPNAETGAGRPRKDWCRNSEWTPRAREKFFLRLSSLPDTAKYLRRKAGYLLADNPAAAADLLAMAIAQEQPRAERIATLRELARARARSGEPADAARAWQAALAAGSDDATTPIQLAVEYAAFVAGHQRIDDYADAAARIAGLDEQLLDPVQRFLFHAARALLAAAGGDDAGARLDAASAQLAHRQFADTPREFPEAALLGATARGVYARLDLLAAAS